MTTLECCNELAGTWNEDNTLCENAQLVARKYDILNPCVYTSQKAKGIADSFLPKGVAEGCFTVGSTLIYFVPSMNKYVIKDSVGSDGLITRYDIPPNSDSYDELVLHNINVGAVTILVIAVAIFYLIKRMKR